MSQIVNIRGTDYEVVNATDIQVTILTQAIQNGMTDAVTQAQVAYTIKSACPNLPPELISHRLIRVGDGSSEEIFAQNLDADEVVAFASAFTVAMLEMRIERLKGMATGKEDEVRVKDAITKIGSAIDQTKDSTKNIQLEVLLSGVEAAGKQLPSNSTPKPRQSFKGFTPAPSGIKTPTQEVNKLNKLRSQMAELEAEMSRMQTVDVSGKKVDE